MNAQQLGHRGAWFAAYAPDGTRVGSGELALEPNRNGEYGYVALDYNRERLAKMQEARRLASTGMAYEAAACLREVYQEVEDHWITAEESMLNIAMRPIPFDI